MSSALTKVASPPPPLTALCQVDGPASPTPGGLRFFLVPLLSSKDPLAPVMDPLTPAATAAPAGDRVRLAELESRRLSLPEGWDELACDNELRDVGGGEGDEEVRETERGRT